MSNSLVRRGLDLYKNDLISADQKSSNELHSYKRKKSDNETTVKHKKLKSTQDIRNKHLHKDNTADNLKALQYVRMLNTDEKRSITQGVEREAMKRKQHKNVSTSTSIGSKTRNKKRSRQTDSEQSVFTEEDFEKFFKEYDFKK